jgi:hypothetical protein
MEAAVISIETGPKHGHKYWTKELDAAVKRLRRFRKQGTQVVQRFLDERKDLDNYHEGVSSRLNLFHKNTSMLLDMMYGQTPQIDVTREHYDPDDDQARVAALMFQRILQSSTEPSGESLGDCLRAALQDRLLPGLGQARVRYEFDAEVAQVFDPETGGMLEVDNVTDERAPVNYVHWQDFLWGWGRTWPEVPWVAFRAYMDKDSVTERFGEEAARDLEYKNQTPDGDDEPGDSEQKEVTQKAEIWEIWDKDTKKVYWHGKGASKCLDIRDDPLGLEGFFPCPRPLMANCTTTLFIPKADYTFAQDLYNEIDVLQSRIAKITRAIKVVGVYDKSAGDSVGRMLKEGSENEMIPVDNWAMFSEKGQLAGVIDWFPVQEVVGTLQVLQQIQQSKIEQLYEVTGLSDIMRGANTDQYTAAATQGMKAKMGSIAVQAMQDDFARFASDIESLKAEVIAKHFDPPTIAKQANAQFLPEADKPLIEPALALIKSPDIKWRINIKPESLSMVDYAQLKQERSEFLMSMAQYIQSASSAVQAIPDSMPILLELMKWAMAGFKGSEYLEGTMDQAIKMASEMPPPGEEEKGPSPEEVKMQIEQMKLQGQQQKAQMEQQKIQMKAQADMATMQAKVQGEIAKINADAERDMTIEQVQAQNRLRELAMDLQNSMDEIQANLRSSLTIERAQASFDIQSQDNAHANTMREIAAQRSI